MPDRDIELPVMAEVVVSADIGGMQIQLSASRSNKELRTTLDEWRIEVNRQRTKLEYEGTLVDLQSRREALELSPERERDYRAGRVEERARLIAEWQAEHDHNPARRGDFTLTQRHRQALDGFDGETKRKVAEFAADRAKMQADLPILEKRLAVQRQIMAGGERAEVIERLLQGEPHKAAAD